MPTINLIFDTHSIQCPHCQQETEHHWPGSTILFATAECGHCYQPFLVVLNQSWSEKEIE
jgi:hypothetical protein